MAGGPEYPSEISVAVLGFEIEAEGGSREGEKGEGRREGEGGRRKGRREEGSGKRLWSEGR